MLTAHRNMIAVIRDACVDHGNNSRLFLGREFEAEFGPGLPVSVYDQNPSVEGIGEINAYSARKEKTALGLKKDSGRVINFGLTTGIPKQVGLLSGRNSETSTAVLEFPGFIVPEQLERNAVYLQFNIPHFDWLALHVLCTHKQKDAYTSH